LHESGSRTSISSNDNNLPSKKKGLFGRGGDKNQESKDKLANDKLKDEIKKLEY